MVHEISAENAARDGAGLVGVKPQLTDAVIFTFRADFST
jgi:hypothetical protein